MKIYKRSWNDLDEGRCNSWHSTKLGAENSSIDTQSPDLETVKVELVDFPSSKKEIIKWLNCYLDRQNG